MLTNTVPREEQMAARFHFANLAGQYYISGRFAALAHCVPVAGSLLHHAVECFLKCGLVEVHSLAQLRSKAFGHSLPNLWEKFKLLASDSSLNAHDWSVSELDKFERLRYPDLMVSYGMQVSLVIKNSEFSPLPSGPQPPFHLVIESVDVLAKAIASACGLSNAAMFSSSHPSALHFLHLHNLHWNEHA
jgi:hypothetical protein